MSVSIKGTLLVFLLAILEACTNSSSDANGVLTYATCSDRVIDSSNPPSHVAVLGNSLLLGSGSFGLAASDSTKDYFARIDSAFKRLNPDCVSNRVMSKHTENTTNDSDLFASISENIMPGLSDSNDLVIIQLGDNIDTDDEMDRLETTVGNIMDSVCTKAPNAKVVWVGEWYSTKRKQSTIEQLARMRGIQFIDISDLNVKDNQARVADIIQYPEVRTQSINYVEYHVYGIDTLFVAFEEDDSLYQTVVFIIDHFDIPEKKQLDFVGNLGIITDSFAASHPSDKGFELIAQRILGELGL